MKLLGYLILGILIWSMPGCSPYSKELKDLKAMHASGKIKDRDYLVMRHELLQQEGAWRDQVTASCNVASARMMQTTAEINARNAARQPTVIYAQPRDVNVYIRNHPSVGPTNYPY